MYSYEDRLRAVRLHIKLGKRAGLTIRQLGYPTKNALKHWHRGYEQRLDLSAGYERPPKYSQAQRELAVDHYLEHGRCLVATIKGLCRSKAIEENGVMLPLHIQLQNSTLRGVLKRLHFPLEAMLVCVRWYAAYPLSLRHLEEMMAERGVFVDHATVHRWTLKMLPVLAKIFRRRKHPVGSSWRVDETYVKVAGEWKYHYRAVDKLGQTVDFLLTARRDEAAARRFFEQAIDKHDAPEKITIDKSGANTAAVQG